MKKVALLIAVSIVLAGTGRTQAQFDFGSILEGQARQAFQKLENRVPQMEQRLRREVQHHLREIIPPGQIIPRPPTKPPVRPFPIKPPVRPLPIKPAPIHPPGEIIICPPNDGIIVAPPEIQPPATKPVQPQPKLPAEPEPKLPAVEVGSVVTINGDSLGQIAGQVFVKIDSLILKANAINWTNTEVEAQLPDLPILEAYQASVIVMNANEEIVEHLEVNLTPAEPENSDEAETDDTPVVYPGQQLTIEGELGDAQGKVEMQIGDTKLSANVLKWTKSEVTFSLPALALVEPQPANLVVLTAQGNTVDSIAVVFSSDDE